MRRRGRMLQRFQDQWVIDLVESKNYWSLNARRRMSERQGKVCFTGLFIPTGHHYRAQVSTTLLVSSL